MTLQTGSPAPSFADLEPEIVCNIYSINWESYGSFGSSLGLRDRVRGLVVCQAWAAALRALPVPLVTLCADAGSGAAAPWLPWRSARVQSLRLTASSVPSEAKAQAALAAAALFEEARGRCDGQALTELHYDMPGTVLVRLLPAPHHAYPNLEQLEANISADTADPQAWVAALAQLPRLRSLRLRRLAGWGGLTAPSGAALTELVLAAQGGVEVGLRGLPALRRLCIHSDAAPFLAHGGTVKVRIEEELASATASGDGASGGRSGTAAGGSCSSGLRELKVWCAGELDLDFGLLPQLEQLSLTVGSLSDAASAGTCTALSRLWLSGSPTVARQLMEALPRPEELAVLRSRAFSEEPDPPLPALLPAFRSLRRLDVHADGGGEDGECQLAAALQWLTALESLQLRGSVAAPPAHATLTHLCLEQGLGRAEDISIDLAQLPALLWLEVTQDGAACCLRLGSSGGVGRQGSPSRLRRLSSSMECLSLDPALVPGLDQLELTDFVSLAPDSQEAPLLPPSLRRLALYTPDSRTAAQLLSAGTGLRALALGMPAHIWERASTEEVPAWGELVQALGALTQLSVLALDGHLAWALGSHAERGSLFAAGAPVWRTLRTLSLGSCSELPPGISEARRLERLQAGTGLCSPAKLRQLATLPALRHLRLCYTTKLARAHELAPSVYSVLPHLGSLDVGHEMTPCVEFLRLVGAGE